MRKFRIYNDIPVMWRIVDKQTLQPLELEGKELTVIMETRFGAEPITDFAVNGNIISFIFKASQQQTLGVHTLKATIKDTATGQTWTVDDCQCLELVARSCCADVCDCSRGVDATSCVEFAQFIVVDQELEEGSTNPVAGGAVAEAINGLGDDLNRMATEQGTKNETFEQGIENNPVERGSGAHSLQQKSEPNNENSASGRCSVALGHSNEATALCSYVEGYDNASGGWASHVEGVENEAGASAHFAHVGGTKSNVEKEGAFVHGRNLKAVNKDQAVFGHFNKADETGKSLFEVGGGTSEEDRKNLFQVDEDGTVRATNPDTGEAFDLTRDVAALKTEAVTTTEQSLTDEQKAQARENIGALSATDVPQDALENLLAYGVEWDTEVSSTAMTRIGNLSFHRTLPIQSMMRGCLLDDDGNVVEYLPAGSWVGSTLDGSKGQVMVEIPEHYRKHVTNGKKRQTWISTFPLSGYKRVKKMYISAYEATVQHSTTKLCSVVNTDADYRGGNNNSDWDGTYRTLLGRPATVISRTNFRNYARKRKSSTTEWNCQDYNAYKAVFWLYYVEYANRNCQLAFNAEKDANGYAQGGLGNGITTVGGTAWGEYNNYYPFVPCGHTDELGNGSGEVAYEALNEDGSVWATVYANRYRGIENPFGHIWKWTDGINIKISPTEENGGDNTSKVYVADNPANYKDTGYDGYAVQGLEARTEGYVRQLVFGEQGDIMPAVVGGGSTTYWADLHYTNIPTSEALRGVLFGGTATYGANAGFGYAYTNRAPSDALAIFGSRLCFIPAK